MFRKISLPITNWMLVLGLSALLYNTANAQSESNTFQTWVRTAKASNPHSKYNKLRADAMKQYNDPKQSSFRRQVGESFRQKQREHGEYALLMNLSHSDRPLAQTVDGKFSVEDTLYDNAEAQRYVNRIGQSLVPSASQNLYAFKITLNPFPEARASSNGTIYISTGMLALLSNEAQLSFVLAHEIAHIEHHHWFEDVMIERLVREKNQRKLTASTVFTGMSVNLVRAFTGWVNVDPLVFRMYEKFGAPSLVKVAFAKTPVTWDAAQEDEADTLAVSLLLSRNYDLREVKGLYEKVAASAKAETSLQQSFIASEQRIGERRWWIETEMKVRESNATINGLPMPIIAANQRAAQQQLASSLIQSSGPGKTLTIKPNAKLAVNEQQSAELARQTKAGTLIANRPEFAAQMSHIKRDNAIRAYQYDLFSLARIQLDEVLQANSKDALAHYYKGRVWLQTARTPLETQTAMNALRYAATIDGRKHHPEIHTFVAQFGKERPARTLAIK
jgi:predicted Zn-dependent protease